MKKMSLNPMRQIWNLATVNEWYYLQETELEYRKPLKNAIELGTYVSLDPYSFFFSNIYLPIKQMNPTTGLSEQWTYENIGLSPEEIAQIYTTYNGLCYIYPGLDKQNPALSIRDLGDRIRSVFLLNKPKYMKLIELQGYTYNPLFNVDGVEIRQSLENNGINNVTTSSGSYGRGLVDDSGKTTHNVSSYDNGVKEEYNDVTEGQESDHDLPQLSYDPETGEISSESSKHFDSVSQRNASYAASGSNTKYEHNNALNKKWNETTQKYDEEEYTVSAEDTAFKQALVGGDKMHNEKYIRQGNIGVTKTQELIEAERQNLRYSVVKEFFDDINAQILVGIY